MVKTPQQMKEMMIEWCDSLPIPYRFMTDREIGIQPLEFGMLVGGVQNTIVVFVNSNLPSRVIFNMQIKFVDEHRKITREMSKENYDNFVLKITDRMANYGVDWHFGTEGQEIKNLTMTVFIDESALEKDRFYQTVNRCQVIKAQVIRAINVILGGDVPASSSSGSDTPSMYH